MCIKAGINAPSLLLLVRPTRPPGRNEAAPEDHLQGLQGADRRLQRTEKLFIEFVQDRVVGLAGHGVGLDEGFELDGTAAAALEEVGYDGPVFFPRGLARGEALEGLIRGMVHWMSSPP